MTEMASTSDRPDLLEVAFELIAEQGLAGLSMSALALRAGVPLVEVYQVLPSPAALITRLSERVDEAMLTIDRRELEDLPARDRIFELMMRRLDALGPFRNGIARLLRDLGRAPELVLLGGCRADRSLAWLQEAADLPSAGVRARADRLVLGAAYARAVQVWLGDEGADLARTMAELDKTLRRMEPFLALRSPAEPAMPGDEASVPQSA